MVVDIREVVDGAVLSCPLAPDTPDVLVQRKCNQNQYDLLRNKTKRTL